ncbi:aldehyde dehydrogenase family protein [Micrococcales bacterium 31B]|nr:aldehyde dehydrogenase family protein [Micrococcales bacterium 31B]
MTVTTPTSTIVRGDASAFFGPSELPPLAHYINGSFDISTAPTSMTTVENPATGKPLAEVPNGEAADVDRAVGAARDALTTWRRTTPRERADILLAIADRIAANADRLRRLEAVNTGKPPAVTEDDIASAVDVFRFAAGATRVFTEVGSGDYAAGHTSIILREPVGVVGAVVPWNYPLLMAAWKLAPILGAGNTVVIKPSEQTPLSLLALVEVMGDLLPAGVLNVVLGLGPEVGGRLSTHPDIDMVALTGSVNSGRAVATSAGETLKRVHLELGGKAPVVILPDADLDRAAEAIRNAGYWNAGQECGAGTRVLVHREVAERFTEALAAQVSTFVVGEPWAGAEVELGPLVSKAHFERVTAFIDRALADGATAVVGGGPLDGPGYFVAPTVLADVAADSEAALEEIFGPVVTIETFETVDEAIDRANAVKYGLAASVWTRDSAHALELPRRLDFGTVWVNAHLVIANEMPWGGFKGSGYGRDLSAYALTDFTRTKHVQMHHEL